MAVITNGRRNYGKYRRVEFSDMTDLLAYAANAPAVKTKGVERGSSWSGDPAFTGTANYDEAVKLAQNGWKQGLVDIDARLSQIKGKEELVASNYQWDVTGDFFDVGAMLTGEPEHWMYQDYEPVRKVVKVWFNSFVSCAVDKQTIMNRGAAIVALCHQLQEHGYIVEPAMAFFGGAEYATDDEHTEMFCPFGSTPIDLDMLGFVCGHPSWFRRILFAVGESMYQRKLSSYWTPLDIPKELSDSEVIYMPGAKYGPNGYDQFTTVEQAAKWVGRVVEDLLNRETNKEAA